MNKEKIKLGIPIENEATGKTNVILRTNEIRIVEEAFEEIERLNNIINELEKGIKENIEELEEHQLSRDRIDEDKEILRFLQELRGSESNE